MCITASYNFKGVVPNKISFINFKRKWDCAGKTAEVNSCSSRICIKPHLCFRTAT